MAQQWVDDIIGLIVNFRVVDERAVSVYTDEEIITRVTAHLEWINVMSFRYQMTILKLACGRGKGLALFLLSQANIDLNADREHVIFTAIREGSMEVIRAIWNHPQFDPTLIVSTGYTVSEVSPFLFACVNMNNFGDTGLLEMMLADPRVDIKQLTSDGTNALGCALSNKPRICKLLEYAELDPFHSNHYGNSYVSRLLAPNMDSDCVEIFIASIRYVEPDRLAENYRRQAYDMLARGEQTQFGNIGPFLKEYCQNPSQTRWKLRRKLGLQHYDGVILFVYVTMLNDGYLKWNDTEHPLKRPVTMALQLPAELQMLFCNRIYGCAKDYIRKDLFRKTLRCMLIDQKFI